MGRRTAAGGWDTHDNLYDLYVNQGLSTGAIAKLYPGTFANTIRRALKRHGIKTRSKSDAQKVFLEANDHPMLGRPRTEDERKRISEGIQQHWDGLSPEQDRQRREEMAERARMKWEWMSEAERDEMIASMHKANREKAGLGSKNENAVANMLRDEGYTVYQRTTEYSPRRAFEIDAAIPAERIAIEWDGAAHYEPIYGDEALKKTIEKDARKNRALVDHGWRVIRCRDHSTAHSMAFCTRAVQKIIKAIKNIQDGEIIEIDAF
jgi:very-short-patch-repair endonuclease